MRLGHMECEEYNSKLKELLPTILTVYQPNLT